MLQEGPAYNQCDNFNILQVNGTSLVKTHTSRPAVLRSRCIPVNFPELFHVRIDPINRFQKEIFGIADTVFVQTAYALPEESTSAPEDH